MSSSSRSLAVARSTTRTPPANAPGGRALELMSCMRDP